jgi:hypothetical protein
MTEREKSASTPAKLENGKARSPPNSQNRTFQLSYLFLFFAVSLEKPKR